MRRIVLLIAAVALCAACTSTKPTPAPSTSSKSAPATTTGLIVGTGQPCIGPGGSLLEQQYEKTHTPITRQSQITLTDLARPGTASRNLTVTSRYDFHVRNGHAHGVSAEFNFTVRVAPGTYRLTEPAGATTVHVLPGQTAHATLISYCL